MLDPWGKYLVILIIWRIMWPELLKTYFRWIKIWAVQQGQAKLWTTCDSFCLAEVNLPIELCQTGKENIKFQINQLLLQLSCLLSLSLQQPLGLPSLAEAFRNCLQLPLFNGLVEALHSGCIHVSSQWFSSVCLASSLHSLVALWLFI